VRLLITGNQGYIGAVGTAMAKAAGHDVVGLDSNLYHGCDFGLPMLQCEQITKDIRDVEPADLRGIDAIWHLAALCNDPLGDLDPELTTSINFRASVRLAEAAKRAGVKRFVFASSCSMYGASGDQMIDETSPLSPLTAYARSKVWTEESLRQMADRKFCLIFMRNATAYGSSPRLRLDLVLNNLVASAHATGTVHIKSDGSPWRPIVHIEDITAAALAVLEAPLDAVHNQSFNVGSNSENYQVRDLADIVRETVPGSRIEYAPGGAPDLRCYRVSFDRIARVVPGFRPRWTARLGAEQMYRDFKRFNLRAEDVEGANFKRIGHIGRMTASGSLRSDLRWMPAVAAAGSGAMRP
jgi:nucleoside-diphosphate-sugar epimerase